MSDARSHAARRVTPADLGLGRLFDSLRDAIVVADAEGRIVLWNPAAERIFGYPAREAAGMPLEALIPPDFRPHHRAGMERFRKTGHGEFLDQPRAVELPALRKDGKAITVEMTLNPLMVGGERYAMAVLRDATERRHAVEELRLARELAFAIGEADTVHDALGIALRRVCEATGWALGQAWLPNQDGDRLVCSPAWHAADTGLEPFRAASTSRTFLRGKGLPGRVWATGERLWITDVRADPSLSRAPAAQQVGIATGMAVPVLARDEVVAVLEFFVREPREEDERHFELVGAVAAQLGALVARKATEEELRESEERLRRLAEASFEGLCFHEDGFILDVNGAFARMFGYAPEELVGHRVPEVVAPESRELVAERIAARFEGPYECVGRRRDGTTFPIEVQARHVPLGGKTVRAAAVRDVTARKRAEAELRATLALLAATLEATADGIAAVDEEGRVTQYNRRFLEMWGLQPEDLATSATLAAAGAARAQDPEGFLARMKEVEARPAGAFFDAVPLRDGRVLERYVHPQRFGDEVVGRVHSFRDATQRRRAEAELRTSEERFRQVFEESPVGMALEGPDLTFLRVNGALARMLRCKPQDLVGRSALDVTHPDDRAADAPLAEQVFAGTLEGYQQEKRYVALDGTVVWAELSMSAVRGPGGAPAYGIAIIEDVTERRRAAEERRVAYERLREIERLKEMDAFKTRLLNVASHEINTPLTAIQLQVDLLRSHGEGDGARQQKGLEVLARNVDRLSTLVREMLDVARLQSGKLQLKRERTDLAELAREAAQSFEEPARQAGVKLDVRVPRALAAEADHQRVMQVLFNFLSNALKFTPRGGSVTLEVAREREEAVVRVHDTGIGLTEEQRARLFQPFSQVHGDPELARTGTGLGLYISKGIVDQHGGRMWAESAGPGKGSTFAFALPPKAST